MKPHPYRSFRDYKALVEFVPLLGSINFAVPGPYSIQLSFVGLIGIPAYLGSDKKYFAKYKLRVAN